MILMMLNFFNDDILACYDVIDYGEVYFIIFEKMLRYHRAVKYFRVNALCVTVITNIIEPQLITIDPFFLEKRTCEQ